MVLSFRHGTHWHAVLAMATAHTQSHFLCHESHTYTHTLSNIPTLLFKKTFLGILRRDESLAYMMFALNWTCLSRLFM